MTVSRWWALWAVACGREVDGAAETGTAPPVDSGVTTPPDDPVDADSDGVAAGDDCDDADPSVFPGAPERCDGLDNDCDLAIDGAGPASVGDQVFGSVAEALYAAGDGDTVELCEGTWLIPSSRAWTKGTLTVVGRGRELTAASTVGGGPLFSLSGDATLTLQGLSIADSDSAALVVGGTATLALVNVGLFRNVRGLELAGNGVTVTLDDVTVAENGWAGQEGSGVYAANGYTLTIRDSRFTDNEAQFGAGLYLNGAWGGSAVLERTTLDGHFALEGGALYLEEGATATLSQCAVTSNQADTRGSGAYLGDDSQLISTETDWGTGATANPKTIAFSTASIDFAGVQSFVCSGIYEVCIPTTP